MLIMYKSQMTESQIVKSQIVKSPMTESQIVKSSMTESQMIELKQMIVHTMALHPETSFDTEMFEDWWLMERFLSTRKYDLCAAHDALIKASKWRNQHQVKIYSRQDCLKQIATGKCRFYGHDKQDHPVCYIFPKLHLNHKHDPSEFEHFLIWVMECNSKLRAQGLVVIDFKGTSLSNLDLGHLSMMITMLQDYYPGLLAQLLILNLPAIIRAPLGVVKKMLDVGVAGKIVFTKRKLLDQYIDPDQILPDQSWAQPIDPSTFMAI